MWLIRPMWPAKELNMQVPFIISRLEHLIGNVRLLSPVFSSGVETGLVRYAVSLGPWVTMTKQPYPLLPVFDRQVAWVSKNFKRFIKATEICKSLLAPPNLSYLIDRGRQNNHLVSTFNRLQNLVAEKVRDMFKIVLVNT